MRIAQSKTRGQFPLSEKKILKKTISSTLAWILLFILIYVPVAFGLAGEPGSGGYLAAVTAALLAITGSFITVAYLYQRQYFAAYFYDLTPDYVVIRKGPITPHEITIPYERIQDVYVDQDLLDRILGLYDVHLSSATVASGSAAHIDGVGKEAAAGLRDALLKEVSARIGKNRSQAPAEPRG